MAFFKKIVIAILLAESRAIVRKYKPRIVAVTGSVGKTSAKDAIYAVLAHGAGEKGGFVRKSDKSFNSEIGMPLTVLGAKNAWRSPLGWLTNILHGLELVFFKNEYPSTLVLEVGADHPGDIRNLVKWLKPDVAVISRIGETPVHVEFFPSPEAVRAEKLSLAEAVKPGGTVVLYGDDDRLRGLSFEGRNVMTFGMRAGSAVRGEFPTVMYKEGRPTGMSFKASHLGNSVPILLEGVLGEAQIYPVLAAAAVGLASGMTLVAIAEAIAEHVPPRGRMNAVEGLNGSTLIDDSYNSSPAALASALETLKSLEAKGRKIAILGDMMELGQYSVAEHKKGGTLAAGSADILITVGLRAARMKDGATAAGMPEASILSFDDSYQAAAKVPSMIQPGDIVLVKGSQSPRMERVSKALLADPSKAASLLVRQEKEWLDKK